MLLKQLPVVVLLLVGFFLNTPAYSQPSDSITHWENLLKKETNDSLKLCYYSKLMRATIKTDPVKANEYKLDAYAHSATEKNIYH